MTPEEVAIRFLKTDEDIDLKRFNNIFPTKKEANNRKK